VDEVHRCGAELFADTLNSLPARHKDGMSATPNRRDGKHVLFKDFFGPKYVEAEEYRDLLIPTVDIKQVPIKFPVLNPTKDWAKALTKVYSDEKYLDTIVNNTKDLLDEGRNCLLLGIRTEALAYLQTKIPRSLVLDGTVKKKEDRANILARVGKDINCLLSTTIFDEGLSCHILDTLILTEPVGKNFSKLEQRIGRIQREHPDKQPICLQVYWLQNKILEGQQKIEYMWYQHNKFYFKK
jgi:superfamily II DNA or RNA helicase